MLKRPGTASENDPEPLSDAEEAETNTNWFDSETKSFLASMLVHLLIILGLASYTIVTQPDIIALFIESQHDADELPPFDIVNDIAYSVCERALGKKE